jgi:hypothetical protein
MSKSQSALPEFATMELTAVTCIATAHHVAFLRLPYLGADNLHRWAFYDSMCDMEKGHRVPILFEVPGLARFFQSGCKDPSCLSIKQDAPSLTLNRRRHGGKQRGVAASRHASAGQGAAERVEEGGEERRAHADDATALKGQGGGGAEEDAGGAEGEGVAEPGVLEHVHVHSPRHKVAFASSERLGGGERWRLSRVRRLRAPAQTRAAAARARRWADATTQPQPPRR